LTPEAMADLRTPIIIAAISLFTSFSAAWILRERRRQVVPTVILALGMAGFFFAAYDANNAFTSSLSSQSLALEINKILRPGDQIAVYGDIRVAPSIAFYSHRRVLLYNATGSNLEFGAHFPDAPKTFFTDQDFLPLWEGQNRIFLVVPAEKNAEVLRRLPKDSTWILAATAGKTVYENHPPGT
jgi:hypothetical protein